MLYRALVLGLLVVAASEVNGQAPKADHSAARYVPAAQMRRDVRSAPQDIPGASRVGYVEAPLYWTAVIRRTSAGESEVHERVADIWYVISGEADVVTDGEITGSRESGPHEVRGKGVAKGHSYRMRAGDVLHVPAGVPHWVKRVHKEFIYFIVKVEPQ